MRSQTVNFNSALQLSNFSVNKNKSYGSNDTVGVKRKYKQSLLVDCLH